MVPFSLLNNRQTYGHRYVRGPKCALYLFVSHRAERVAFLVSSVYMYPRVCVTVAGKAVVPPQSLRRDGDRHCISLIGFHLEREEVERPVD